MRYLGPSIRSLIGQRSSAYLMFEYTRLQDKRFDGGQSCYFRGWNIQDFQKRYAFIHQKPPILRRGQPYTYKNSYHLYEVQTLTCQAEPQPQ